MQPIRRFLTSMVITDKLSEHRKTRLKNISKSLQYYLKNLSIHEKMMKTESAEFELGKRHLANIMGWPSDMKVAQEDIDRAIRYLFPSGLTCATALPVMKPPEEILPKFKKMEFDNECRPLDTLFYTISPKFYHLISEINENTHRLINFYDQLRLSGRLHETDKIENKLVLNGSEWLSKEALSAKFDSERITDDMYASCIMALNYLVSLPLSHFFHNFIMELRQTLTTSDKTNGVIDHAIFGYRMPSVQIDPVHNRRYAETNGKVKRMIYAVRVNDAGTGQFTVDGHHYSELRSLLAREILMAPLIVTDLLGKVDVAASVVFNPIDCKSGNEIVVPRSIRHGTALCLAALYPEHREILRLSGLLTLDVRKKERSKINQPGARAKWIWKKR